jgi:cell division protein FtsB
MLDQIKNNYYQKMKNNLGDIRFIVLMVFLAIVLLVTWSGIKTVQSNYMLQKKITKINQSNQLQKLKNNNLSLQNNYLNTNQFIEISDRQNFGVGASGE